MEHTVNNPYLSIVVVSRNDNHGGDLTKRTSAFVNSVYVQAKKYKLQTELIFVEWNPLADKPYLKDVLPLPHENEFVSLRFIIVSKEIHDTYRNGATIPLYQMIGKNVGIRRAKGAFVLCTNVDILFSDKNFEFLAEKKLQKGTYYRANRCDIPVDVMNYDNLEEQLKYAEKNSIKRLGKNQHFETLHLPSFVYRFPIIPRVVNKLVLKLWHATHKGQFAHFTVDFDACGDYTLMAKEDWEKIQGYPELDMYSIHIDSMGLWAANAVGMKQFILDYKAPVYHIYHENGWESDDAVKTIKFLENKPCLDYSIVHKAGLQIVAEGKTWSFNDDNWGLIDKELEEFTF
ncbi:MAG TPA: hypothetical protein PLP27_00780 [Crocinitomicaceae bacterium]|nr:hypothetical protein [Crocinitomicaceae bacterium]